MEVRRCLRTQTNGPRVKIARGPETSGLCSLTEFSLHLHQLLVDLFLLRMVLYLDVKNTRNWARKKEGELQLLNNYGLHRLELGPQGHYAISLLRWISLCGQNLSKSWA